MHFVCFSLAFWSSACTRQSAGTALVYKSLLLMLCQRVFKWTCVVPKPVALSDVWFTFVCICLCVMFLFGHNCIIVAYVTFPTTLQVWRGWELVCWLLCSFMHKFKFLVLNFQGHSMSMVPYGYYRLLYIGWFKNDRILNRIFDLKIETQDGCRSVCGRTWSRSVFKGQTHHQLCARPRVHFFYGHNYCAPTPPTFS